MIHEQTGHECVFPRPDGWPLPESFIVEVKRGDPDSEDLDVWYAIIKGDCPDGKLFDQVTFGETPAHAMLMAYDVVRMLWDECDVSGPSDEVRKAKHCYCRDVTTTGAFTMPRAAKQCCKCTQVTVLSEFEETT